MPRHAVMVLLTRTNFHTSIGNFKIDLEDGEVRFKPPIDLEGTTGNPTVFGNQAISAAFTLTGWQDGIKAVAPGRMTVAAAYDATTT